MTSNQTNEENESDMELSNEEESDEDASSGGDEGEAHDESLLSVGTPAQTAKIWNWVKGGNGEAKDPFDELDSGWTRDIPTDYKEIDFWKLTFPEEILRKIVWESNQYAIEVMENQAHLSRRQEKFQVVTYEELLRYLAIRINMGIDQKPEQKMYWSTDPLLGSIAIRQIMGSDRYFEVQRYLHLSDVESPDETDKLFKVRQIWDQIMSNFQQLLVPFENLSVDESLIKFRGRFRIIQFIPTKRNRFGVKTFSVVDERTGFILNCVIYEGKSTSEGHEIVSSLNKKHFGHGGGVVLHLCNPYFGKNRTIFADNYFNSPNLAKKLLEEKTFLCGTLRAGRLNAPKPPKRMKKGDLEVVRDQDDKQIMVEFWRDKRVVKMISTGFKHEMMEAVNSRGTVKEKLKTISAYNNNARGIDQGDQMIHMYDTGRKTLKCQTLSLLDGLKVFPILLKTIPDFPLKTILDMRQVHPEWRREIDKLFVANPRRFVADNYTFEDTEHVETFLQHADKLPSGINPFLGNFLRAWPTNEPCLNAVFHLVQKYGKYLKTVSLLLILEAFLTPRQLEQLLFHLPNSESLTIVARFHFEENAIAYNFPPLPHLTEMDISGFMSADLNYNEHLQALTTSIITTYGHSLTSLGCSRELMQISGLSQLTPNLKRLFAYSLNKEDFILLSRMDWRLESLYLRCDYALPGLELVSALNKFRSTLMSLEFTVLLEENFNSAFLQVFPKLTEVYVKVDCLPMNSLVSVRRSFSHLPVVCPNLEQLSIKLTSRTLTKSVVNPDKIFRMFSKLKILNL